MRTPASLQRITFLATALSAALLLGRQAAAQNPVTSIGDVSPVDLPFVPGDQGIPSSGNTIETDGVDFFGNPIDLFGNRLIDDDGLEVGQFNYERSANIEVGRYSSGQLLITGGGELRFGDLLIGGDVDAGSFEANFESFNLDIENDQGDGGASGVGLVRIVGLGSLYNNHPGIIPTQYQDPSDPEDTIFDRINNTYNPTFDLGGFDDIDLPAGVSDRIFGILRDLGQEYDLYVGLTGSGVLDILEGGRAEIYDGAFIGIGPNATGVVNVDGSGSYLGVYGTRMPVTGGGGESQMVIGLYGEGALNITNGGRVDSFNRAALGTLEADDDNTTSGGIDERGHGQVLVEGAGSVWRVFTPEDDSGNDSVALSIGRFPSTQNPNNRLGTLLAGGDGNTTYQPDEGRGTLRIREGGLVFISNDDVGTGDDDSSVRIGKFGELQLNGGRIVIADRLDNDGLIRTGDNLNSVERYGDGVIETGTFFNSIGAQVRVRAGEHLQIRSLNDDGQGEQVIVAANTTDYFYANAGKIEVLGDQAVGKAEIEFLRDLDESQNGDPEDDRFKNLRLVNVPDQSVAGMSTYRGQIKARDANLFFRSDFLNEADVFFVGGDNVVSGWVENDTTGLISLSNESHVTFQDRVVNNGLIVLDQESDVTFGDGLSGAGALIDLNPAQITVLGDYQTNGALEFVIGGGSNGLDYTRFGVTGDAVFDADSTLAIDAISLTGVIAGSTFDLIDVRGAVTDSGLTTIELPTAPTGLAFVPDTDLTDGVYTLSVIDLAGLGIVGADLDGDDFVDFADVQVWLMFNGLQSGGSLATGDLDGDGDVDAADLAIIQDQLGGAPVPVSLLGPGLLSASVPEPTAAGLLLAGLLLGGGRRRRGG